MVINVLGHGEFFREMALVDNSPIYAPMSTSIRSLVSQPALSASIQYCLPRPAS